MPSERAKRCAAWVQATHPFIVAEQLVSARLARKRLRMKERQHITNIRALVDIRDALAARVGVLEAALLEIAGDYCEFHTSPLEPWLPAEHGTCQRNGRTELRDERGGYISCCHACYAANALGVLPEVNE